MPNNEYGSHNLTVEQQILITMRKVLSTVIKEITPPRGMRHPLSENTVEDVRQCFSLITIREKELAQIAGEKVADKPRYTDEPKTSHIVNFVKNPESQ